MGTENGNRTEWIRGSQRVVVYGDEWMEKGGGRTRVSFSCSLPNHLIGRKEGF